MNYHSQDLREVGIDNPSMIPSPLTGIFIMANTVKRPLPSEANDPITHESIHSSVLNQPSVSPVLSEILTSHPRIVPPLLPLEEEMKAKWAYEPSSPTALEYEKKLKDQKKTSSKPVTTVATVQTVEVVQADKSGTVWSRIFRVLRITQSKNAKV